MKMFEIANVGTGSKSAYNGAGDRFFVPTALRAAIAVGQFMLIGVKTFTSRTKVDSNGEVEVDENSNPIIEPCDPWTREDVTFVGPKRKAIELSRESELLAAEADEFVAQAKVRITKEYAIEVADAKSLVS